MNIAVYGSIYSGLILNGWGSNQGKKAFGRTEQHREHCMGTGISVLLKHFHMSQYKDISSIILIPQHNYYQEAVVILLIQSQIILPSLSIISAWISQCWYWAQFWTSCINQTSMLHCGTKLILFVFRIHNFWPHNQRCISQMKALNEIMRMQVCWKVAGCGFQRLCLWG